MRPAIIDLDWLDEQINICSDMGRTQLENVLLNVKTNVHTFPQAHSLVYLVKAREQTKQLREDQAKQSH